MRNESLDQTSVSAVVRVQNELEILNTTQQLYYLPFDFGSSLSRPRGRRSRDLVT